MKKSFFILAWIVMGHSLLQAAPYRFTLTTTAISGGTFPTGVTLGQSFVVTILADNGNSVMGGQIWAAANVQSVTFDFGNGALRTVFAGPTIPNPWDATTGSFQTNAGGVLTSVPSSWAEIDPTVLSTNSPQTPNAWFLNGINDMYYTTSGASVGMPSPAFNTVPANWTVAAVPEPSAALLGAVGALGVLRRRR